MKIHEDHTAIKRIVRYRRDRDGTLDLTHAELNEICDGMSWLSIHAPHLCKAAQEQAKALKLPITEMLVAELGARLAPGEQARREGA